MVSSRQRCVKPQRKSAGGRKSKQPPYHPQPKPSPVQRAVGYAHQKLDYSRYPVCKRWPPTFPNPRLRGMNHHHHHLLNVDHVHDGRTCCLLPAPAISAFLFQGYIGVKHLKLKNCISRLVLIRANPLLYLSFLQWGAAKAEIKVPSGENTEFKRSLFKTWSRSVYSHASYA